MPLHVLAIGACLVLVKVSLLDDVGWTMAQPFQRVQHSDLGANILSFEGPSTHRVVGLSFNYKGDHATDVYLDLGDQRYLAVTFPREGSVQGTLVEGMHAQPIAFFPRWTGVTHLRVEAGGVSILAGSREIGRVLQTIPADAHLFVRSGPRLQAVLGTFPRSMVVSIEDAHTPGQIEELRISWLRYGLVVLALTTTMAVVLVYFPLTLAALMVKRRGFRIVRFAILICLPFWPPLLVTILQMQSLLPRDRVLDEALQQLPDATSRTANHQVIRILLIGGSAGQGAPFTIADSISGQLEQIASKQGIPLQVINLSQGSWDAVRWARHMPEVLDSVQPDLAIAYLNFNSLLIGLNRLPTFLIPGLFYYKVLFHLRDWFLDGERMPTVLAAYAWLVDAASERSVPLVILDDPVVTMYLGSQYVHFRRELIAFLSEQGVPVVPVHEWFQEKGASHWHYDTCHLTKTGYAVAARMTWEFLIEHNLVVPSHIPNTTGPGGGDISAGAGWIDPHRRVRVLPGWRRQHAPSRPTEPHH